MPPQVGRRRLHGVEQHGEAIVDLFFQQPPGGGTLLIGVAMEVVERRMISTVRLAAVQLRNIVGGVDGDLWEVGPRHNVPS